MLAPQRQRRIMSELRRSGGVRVTELTELLGVSDMTVRRDLERLSSVGLIEKVHGGAVLSGPAPYEPGFEAKSQLAEAAKLAIAKRAAAMIRPGAAIALSAGTTTWAMAELVSSMRTLTIVTNSPAIADVIARDPSRDAMSVILTGGVRTPSDALVGPVADRSIAGLHVDQLFLGVHGFDRTAGFTTPNIAEAMTNKALLASAREIIVVADSSKWGVIGFADIGPLSSADTLITDSGLPARAISELRDQVGSLVVVDP